MLGGSTMYSINEAYKVLYRVCTETMTSISLFNSETLEVFTFDVYGEDESPYVQLIYEKELPTPIKLVGTIDYSSPTLKVKWEWKETETFQGTGKFDPPVDLNDKKWLVDMDTMKKALNRAYSDIMWAKRRFRKMLKIYNRFDSDEDDSSELDQS